MHSGRGNVHLTIRLECCRDFGSLIGSDAIHYSDYGLNASASSSLMKVDSQLVADVI